MDFAISLGIISCIMVILALSLNLISGYCGQISLGHAAFYGIGAYGAAMATKAGVPFVAALIGGGLLAGVFGILVGFAALRVREDFLAITTMGVGFLFVGIVRQQSWLGGEMGLFGIPDPGFSRGEYLAFVAFLAVLTILFSLYLKRTWTGFGFDAIADDEDTAAMVGIDVARFKLTAFALGTAIAGLAGGLYAHDIRYIGPDSFGFIESITILSIVVVGGIGSVPGIVVMAFVLTLLPHWLQVIAEYKLLLYGGLLFAVMRFSPDGVAGFVRRVYAKFASRSEEGSRV